jgi:cytochrome c biogenesis protein CcdA
LLNTATSIISDVIGNDDKSSAFVYGMYSLFDKFSSGIFLFIITNFFIEKAAWLRVIAGAIPIIAGFGGKQTLLTI